MMYKMSSNLPAPIEDAEYPLRPDSTSNAPLSFNGVDDDTDPEHTL